MAPLTPSLTTSPPDFERIEVGSLVDKAKQQIRRNILNGHLQPGERLRDSVLADEMGVSRSPVREALRLLEQAGLVEKTNNRSYRVPVLAPEDISELAVLRACDEVLAVRMIVARRAPLHTMEAALESIAAAGDDHNAGLTADAGFHAAAIRLAGNPRLIERYAGLTDQIRLVLQNSETDSWIRSRYGTPAALAAERIETHTRLLDAIRLAIRDGEDVAGVVRLWEDHVLTGMHVPHALDPISPTPRAGNTTTH